MSDNHKTPTGLPTENAGVRPEYQDRGLRPESQGEELRSGTRNTDQLVLTEAAQGDKEVSQEKSTATERYLVCKARVMLVKEELRQFNSWGFGKQLAYARGPQDGRQGLRVDSTEKPVQNEVRDPLQDRHKDPWTQTKAKVEQEVVRKP